MVEQPVIPVVPEPPVAQAVPPGSTDVQFIQSTDLDEDEEPLVEGVGQYFNKQTMTYFAAGGLLFHCESSFLASSAYGRLCPINRWFSWCSKSHCCVTFGTAKDHSVRIKPRD
jgi:hypothetical protein